MTKLCVKKPFTVLVGVIMVIVLGVISFTRITTDLLPEMSLPYVVAVTTYPGATPEKVESSVTTVLESSLGVVNGVKSVSSTSAVVIFKCFCINVRTIVSSKADFSPKNISIVKIFLPEPKAVFPNHI